MKRFKHIMPDRKNLGFANPTVISSIIAIISLTIYFNYGSNWTHDMK